MVNLKDSYFIIDDVELDRYKMVKLLHCIMHGEESLVNTHVARIFPDNYVIMHFNREI